MSKKSARFNQQRQASWSNSLQEQQQFSGKKLVLKANKVAGWKTFITNRFWEANQLTDKVRN